MLSGARASAPKSGSRTTRTVTTTGAIALAWKRRRCRCAAKVALIVKTVAARLAIVPEGSQATMLKKAITSRP
jgi:hypothetical protein